MSRVRSTNTGPELAVRRLAHSMGYRYRLYSGELPGRPDLTFPSRRKVIFVHGCFWHGHNCHAGRKRPASNESYWLPKLARNRQRDITHRRRLKSLGWESLAVWECEARDEQALAAQLKKFLAP